MTDFIVVGNKNAIQWKTVFPYYFNNRIRFGYNSVSRFIVPEDSEVYDKIIDGYKLQGLGRWFVSFSVDKHNPPLEYSNKSVTEYPVYDTYPAINVDSIFDVPDYDGEIGVPIGIFDYICPEQFEITGLLCRGSGGIDKAKPIVNGKHLYTRVLIRRRK